MGWRGTHLVPNESRACAHTHHQFITMPIWCLFFFVHTVDRFNPRPDKLTDVLKHLLHYYPFSLLYVTFSHDDDGFHHGDGNCPPARPNRWLNKWREKLHHHSGQVFFNHFLSGSPFHHVGSFLLAVCVRWWDADRFFSFVAGQQSFTSKQLAENCWLVICLPQKNCWGFLLFSCI